MNDDEDLPMRLRKEAEILPHEVYTWLNPLLIEAADEIKRLRAVVRAPLSPSEMRVIDKNCDWVAFQHAWNAVMKGRRIVLNDEQALERKP